MALDVTHVDVWAAAVADKPGGLAEKLAMLAEAGAELEFIISRRTPERPGTAVVFLTPLKGARQLAAARKAGLKKTGSLHSVRVAGGDRPGLGAKIADAVAASGINLRGMSGAVIGRRFIVHLALDSSADATKAIRILKDL